MYLMFDHGGVLDGEYVEHRRNITTNDLILQSHDFGGYQILKNGVSIVAAINELVTQHGAHVVFHSKNKEADQMVILRQLESACVAKNIRFPLIHAMAVYDRTLYPTRASSDPVLLVHNGIRIAGWGADDLDGKASVRRALEALLAIDEADLGNHVVFDDGLPNVTVPREEGYQAHLIGNEEGRVTLDQALQLVLAGARAANQQQVAVAPAAAPAPAFFNGYGALPVEFRQYLSETTQKIRHSMGRIPTEQYWIGLALEEQQRLQGNFDASTMSSYDRLPLEFREFLSETTQSVRHVQGHISTENYWQGLSKEAQELLQRQFSSKLDDNSGCLLM